MSADTVVVSGLGVVGPFGTGRSALAQALAAGRPKLTEVDRSSGRHRPDGARLAALVGALDLSRWVKPAAARRMSLRSKLAVAASRMAIEDAGLGEVGEGWDETAVFVSTAFGPADYTERFFAGIQAEGPESASPFLFTESVANAPAAQMAIDCRARGPNLTVTEREAGPPLAVVQAAEEIARGGARRALAGAVEEMTPLLHRLLDGFGALARATPSLPEAARPFDLHRNGLLAGEGAAVLVLEREEDARGRGGQALARVAGGTCAFDATASRVGWGEGAPALSRALGRWFERKGVDPRAIDLVVSGASGSPAGDRLEARVLREVIGEPLPAVVTPKAVTGEYGAGLLGAAALAVAGATFAAPEGFEPDPELGVVPRAWSGLRPERVLVSSLAAGGAAAWLLLERP